MFINAPLAKVYDYTINPENWSQFYNGLSEPESINGKGEVGTVVKISYSMLGMHFPVIIEVTACEIALDRAKWAGNMAGKFPSKQTSIYVANDNGAELTFEIESGATPENIFGRLMDRLVTYKFEENTALQNNKNEIRR